MGKELLKIRKDKETAFSEIFDTNYVKLCHYAHTFVEDFDQCKDIVQELFAKLWRLDIEKMSSDELSKYLYRSVKNGCLDSLRKQKVRGSYRQQILEKLIQEEEVSISEVEIKELAKAIELALSQLPEQTARIFKMSRFEDKTYAQIASEMDLTVKGVEFHMSKALNILRENLKDYLPLITTISFFIDK
ncbi:RNA polymerase sigma-70 factor [Prolixibacteraceae bacterium JC049]|nr:RNA polymerase sigma-70 factor [Prolixibacteraceae bacterium JC049]